MAGKHIANNVNGLPVKSIYSTDTHWYVCVCVKNTNEAAERKRLLQAKRKHSLNFFNWLFQTKKKKTINIFNCNSCQQIPLNVPALFL